MVRKIVMLEWTELDINRKEITVNTAEFIKNLFAGIPMEKMPRGVEAFEITRDLSKALDESDGKDCVTLEEDLWKFLKKECFEHIPGKWAFVPGLSDAIHSLIHAEKEVVIE